MENFQRQLLSELQSLEDFLEKEIECARENELKLRRIYKELKTQQQAVANRFEEIRKPEFLNLFEEMVALERQEVAATLEERVVKINIKDLPEEKIILVIDNNRDTSRILVHLLKREGYEVYLAQDPAEFDKTIIRAIIPHVIITNMKMPPLVGKQLIKQIHNRGDWRKVPILVLTDNYLEQEVVEILNAGANDCIRKPFNPKELIARVKRLTTYNDYNE